MYILETSPLQVPPCGWFQRQLGAPLTPKKADEEEQGEAIGHGLVPQVLRIVQGELTTTAEALTQTR